MGSTFWVLVFGVSGVLVGVPAAIVYVLQLTDRISLFKGFPPETYRITNNMKEGRGHGLWPTPEAYQVWIKVTWLPAAENNPVSLLSKV